MMVTCPRNTPLKVSLDGLESPSAGLSPGSWEDSFDELSKNLQRICHSPKSDKPPSPLSPATPPPASPLQHTPPIASKPASITETSPYSRLQGTDHVLLRVRHEESSEQLQRQLSRISGFNLAQPQIQEALNESTPSHPSPALARRRISTAGHRLRMQISLDEEDPVRSLSELVIECSANQIKVVRMTPGSDEVVLEEADIDSALDPDRISCKIEDKVLQIRELPNKIRRTEARWGSNACATYCPISVEEDSTWAVVYQVPSCFAAKHVSVKTVDDRLHIMCRQFSPPGSFTPPPAKRSTSTFLKVNLTLPENVLAHSVSAAMMVGVSRLMIYGRTSGTGRARCQTL